MMVARPHAYPQSMVTQALLFPTSGECSTRMCSPQVSARLCAPRRSTRGRPSQLGSRQLFINQAAQFVVEKPRKEKVRTGPPIYAKRDSIQEQDEEVSPDSPPSGTSSPLSSPLSHCGLIKSMPVMELLNNELEEAPASDAAALQSSGLTDLIDPLSLSSMPVIGSGAAVRIHSLSSAGLASLNDMRAVVLQNIPGSGKWLVEIEGNGEVQLALQSEHLEPEKPDLVPAFTR